MDGEKILKLEEDKKKRNLHVMKRVHVKFKK